jgi:hypothetical protein
MQVCCSSPCWGGESCAALVRLNKISGVPVTGPALQACYVYVIPVSLSQQQCVPVYLSVSTGMMTLPSLAGAEAYPLLSTVCSKATHKGYMGIMA